MKKALIVMHNNWLFDINSILHNNDIAMHELISVYAEYYPKVNETHIIICTTE